LQIDGEIYEVVNVTKVGRAVVHILNKQLPKEREHYIGTKVEGKIDMKRRR